MEHVTYAFFSQAECSAVHNIEEVDRIAKKTLDHLCIKRVTTPVYDEQPTSYQVIDGKYHARYRIFEPLEVPNVPIDKDELFALASTQEINDAILNWRCLLPLYPGVLPRGNKVVCLPLWKLPKRDWTMLVMKLTNRSYAKPIEVVIPIVPSMPAFEQKGDFDEADVGNVVSESSFDFFLASDVLATDYDCPRVKSGYSHCMGKRELANLEPLRVAKTQIEVLGWRNGLARILGEKLEGPIYFNIEGDVSDKRVKEYFEVVDYAYRFFPPSTKGDYYLCVDPNGNRVCFPVNTVYDWFPCGNHVMPVPRLDSSFSDFIVRLGATQIFAPYDIYGEVMIACQSADVPCVSRSFFAYPGQELNPVPFDNYAGIGGWTVYRQSFYNLFRPTVNFVTHRFPPMMTAKKMSYRWDHVRVYDMPFHPLLLYLGRGMHVVEPGVFDAGEPVRLARIYSRLIAPVTLVKFLRTGRCKITTCLTRGKKITAVCVARMPDAVLPKVVCVPAPFMIDVPVDLVVVPHYWAMQYNYPLRYVELPHQVPLISLTYQLCIGELLPPELIKMMVSVFDRDTQSYGGVVNAIDMTCSVCRDPLTRCNCNWTESAFLDFPHQHYGNRLLKCTRGHVSCGVTCNCAFPFDGGNGICGAHTMPLPWRCGGCAFCPEVVSIYHAKASDVHVASFRLILPGDNLPASYGVDADDDFTVLTNEANDFHHAWPLYGWDGPSVRGKRKGDFVVIEPYEFDNDVVMAD